MKRSVAIENVQWYWNVLSIANGLECEEEEKRLPSQLIDFVADQFVDSAWFEYHKQYSKTNTVKSVGVHKGLKQTDKILHRLTDECVLQWKMYASLLYAVCTLKNQTAVRQKWI